MERVLLRPGDLLPAPWIQQPLGRSFLPARHSLLPEAFPRQPGFAAPGPAGWTFPEDRGSWALRGPAARLRPGKGDGEVAREDGVRGILSVTLQDTPDLVRTRQLPGAVSPPGQSAGSS